MLLFVLDLLYYMAYGYASLVLLADKQIVRHLFMPSLVFRGKGKGSYATLFRWVN